MLLTINWYSLFYWLSVANNAKNGFVVFITIFTIISFIATLTVIFGKIECSEDAVKSGSKWIWWSYPFMVLFWMLYIFTPSKKDAMLIIAGGAVGEFLTTDSTARQLPADLTNFLHVQLQDLTKESIQELRGGKKVEEMTREELLREVQQLKGTAAGK